MARSAPGPWTIGELAKSMGVTIRTLRYYDKLGLLAPACRTASAHRRYGDTEVQRLYRIVALRSLGFPLPAIAQLLDADGKQPLLDVARRQLDHVRAQIGRYEDLRERLDRVVETLEEPSASSVDGLSGILEVATMTVNLSRIYTRTGDAGETHLGDRARVPKTDPRVEAYGDIDELNAHIGVAIARGDLPDRELSWLRRIQNDLYDVGSDLAAPTNSAKGRAHPRLTSDYVRWLEEACDEANSTLARLNSFVLPGGTLAAAHVHVCRTVCRRAERHALHVKDANPQVVRYLNRLSDLLFIISRVLNTGNESLWNPGQHTSVGGSGRKV